MTASTYTPTQLLLTVAHAVERAFGPIIEGQDITKLVAPANPDAPIWNGSPPAIIIEGAAYGLGSYDSDAARFWDALEDDLAARGIELQLYTWGGAIWA